MYVAVLKIRKNNEQHRHTETLTNLLSLIPKLSLCMIPVEGLFLWRKPSRELRQLTEALSNSSCFWGERDTAGETLDRSWAYYRNERRKDKVISLQAMGATAMGILPVCSNFFRNGHKCSNWWRTKHTHTQTHTHRHMSTKGQIHSKTKGGTREHWREHVSEV